MPSHLPSLYLYVSSGFNAVGIFFGMCACSFCLISSDLRKIIIERIFFH